MASFKCKDFQRLLQEYEEHSLLEADKVSCDLHLGTCRDCREVLDQWRSIVVKTRELEPPTLPPLVERNIIVSALSGTKVDTLRKTSSNWKPVLITAGTALAASIVVILLLLPNKDGDLNRKSTVEHAKTTVPRADENDAKVAAIPNRSLLEVNSDIRLWIRAGTEVSVERNDSKEVSFFLTHGHVVAEIDKRPPGYRFIVNTPKGQVEATGTVFSVEVEQNENSETRVLRGTVKVIEKETDSSIRSTYSLNAGQSGVLGDAKPTTANSEAIERDRCLITGCQSKKGSASAEQEVALVKITPDGRLGKALTKPRKPVQKEEIPDALVNAESTEKEKDIKVRNNHKKETSTVSERIKEALSHRKSGNYQEAADIYREVIERYNKAEATLSCHVSLGQLELEELGKPNVAASNFNKYLKRAPNGFLSEEARLGLVKAHKKTGDQRATIEACSKYIKHHPKGYASAQVLESQAKTYLALDECSEAIETADKLEMWWPNSIESRRLNKALQKCL